MTEFAILVGGYSGGAAVTLLFVVFIANPLLGWKGFALEWDTEEQARKSISNISMVVVFWWLIMPILLGHAVYDIFNKALPKAIANRGRRPRRVIAAPAPQQPPRSGMESGLYDEEAL